MRHLLLLCLLLCGVTQARELLIVGNNYSEPKIYTEGEEPRGMLVDILQYADAAMPDYHFTLHLYPWARAYWMAENAKAGIVGLSWTAERQATFDYSEPLFYDEVLIVVRHGEAFDFDGIDDLKGLRVGIGAGGSFGEEFEQARRHGLFQVDEDNGPVSRLSKLLAGRTDVALINPGRAGLQRAIAQDQELLAHASDLEVLPIPLKRDANYLGFHKQLAMGDFLQAFNAVIHKGYENGDIPRLLERYQQP